MRKWLVDANVLLRLITGEPPEMAARARGLAASLRQGEERLRTLNPLTTHAWLGLSRKSMQSESVSG